MDVKWEDMEEMRRLIEAVMIAQQVRDNERSGADCTTEEDMEGFIEEARAVSGLWMDVATQMSNDELDKLEGGRDGKDVFSGRRYIGCHCMASLENVSRRWRFSGRRYIGCHCMASLENVSRQRRA